MSGQQSSILKKLSPTFWTANTLELFERWAYYGIFNLLAIYLTNSPETGALGFSQVEKGLIMGIVNAILYFLPLITGSIADRFGYKRVLIIAFIILSTGYYLMGIVTTFASVFITFFYVAIGAALFKPIISATIAKTTDSSTASIGFGIFYMMINVGGMIGPLIASELREISWKYVFMMSSGIILLNLVLVVLFYRDPDPAREKESLGKSLQTVFVNIYIALKDPRFLTFLIIIIGAWTVYWQLFYSLPVYIEQWADTTVIYNSLYRISPGLAGAIGSEQGTILTEKIITLVAIFIVLFQVLVSSIVKRFQPLRTMITGILINALGISLAIMTRNGWFIVFSLFIFSIGEMSFSPKILEYIGRIAPRDKAALYMGAQFLPIAFGNFLAGFISGSIYLKLSDKFLFLQDKMLQLGHDLPDVSDSFTQEEMIDRSCELLGTDPSALTEMLWHQYHPNKFMFVLLGIGLVTGVALYIFDRMTQKS